MLEIIRKKKKQDFAHLINWTLFEELLKDPGELLARNSPCSNRTKAKVHIRGRRDRYGHRKESNCLPHREVVKSGRTRLPGFSQKLNPPCQELFGDSNTQGTILHADRFLFEALNISGCCSMRQSLNKKEGNDAQTETEPRPALLKDLGFESRVHQMEGNGTKAPSAFPDWAVEAVLAIGKTPRDVMELLEKPNVSRLGGGGGSGNWKNTAGCDGAASRARATYDDDGTSNTTIRTHRRTH